jgi:hypothetical protein
MDQDQSEVHAILARNLAPTQTPDHRVSQGHQPGETLRPVESPGTLPAVAVSGYRWGSSTFSSAPASATKTTKSLARSVELVFSVRTW